MKKYLWPLGELLVGILPGFFLVFNFMFSDIFGTRERIVSFLLVAVVYLLLGTFWGLTGADYRGSGIWLGLPALFFAVLYSLREVDLIAMNLLYALFSLVFGAAGYRIGKSLSRKRRH
ncbi:MAG: hypothetical protein ACM3ZR_02295 [Pseudomonadota bacterium]